MKLSLEKKSNVDDDSGRGSPSSTTTNTTATTATSCRRRHRNKNKHRQAQTLHPKRLEQISKTHNVEKESIEKLLKLILVQGETIQSQLQKLQDRNKKIEMLEQLQHKNRINMLGSNYVIDTYLNDLDHVTGEPSGEARTQRDQSVNQIEEEDVEGETTLEEEVEKEIKELQQKIELLESITQLNDKIEVEEEKIIQLNHAIKSHENNEQISFVINKIEKLSLNNKTKVKQLETNESALNETNNALLNRKKYLSYLENQFQTECILESEYIHGLEVLNNDIVANTYSSLTNFNKNHRPDDGGSGAMSLQPMGVLDTLV